MLDFVISQDKYKLTQEQNVFIAKKKLVENIYSGAKVEGVNVTFPETQAIVDGINVAKLSVDDILLIHNLKAGWKYTLNNIDSPMTLDFICRINEDVSRNESLDWGHLRSGTVGISGTDYVPAIPKKDEVMSDIDTIMTADTCTTSKALELYAYCCKSQLFWDGNKRTAFIAANKVLIAGGSGLLTIGDANIAEFNSKLTNYYNDDANKSTLLTFLYDKCINAANFKSAALNAMIDGFPNHLGVKASENTSAITSKTSVDEDICE